jgi:hypothetical protein
MVEWFYSSFIFERCKQLPCVKHKHKKRLLFLTASFAYELAQ